MLSNIFAIVLLGLSLVGLANGQANANNTMIFVDYTYFFSAILPSAPAVTVDTHIYNTALAGVFNFGLDWNGDAGDSFTFNLQNSPTNRAGATITFNATSNIPFCRNATVLGTAVTFTAQTVTQCNYTGFFTAGYTGTLSINYNNGAVPPRTQTIDISFLPTTIVGDPQFVGLRGQSYQVHGIDGAVYNLISEANTQVNSRFVFLTAGECPLINGVRASSGCWSHPGSYMGEMSFQTVVDGKLHAALVTAGGAKKGFSAVQMDGKPLSVGDSVSFGAFSLSYNSTHGAFVTLDNFNLELSNSDMFLNLALTAKVPLSQLKSHGLIGQTHSSKTYKNTVKYVEGEVDDYIVADDDVFGTSFPFNQFGQE